MIKVPPVEVLEGADVEPFGDTLWEQKRWSHRGRVIIQAIDPENPDKPLYMAAVKVGQQELMALIEGAADVKHAFQLYAKVVHERLLGLKKQMESQIQIAGAGQMPPEPNILMP